MRKTRKELIKMAKTKRKLAASVVALMVAAVALIGVAYAAYTATLTDSENMTVNNTYVTLGETKTVNNTISLEWNSVNNIDTSTITWTLNAQKAKIGSVTITADNTKMGANTNSTFALTVTINSILDDSTPYALSGVSIRVYSDSDCTSEVADASALPYLDESTPVTYYLAFVSDGTCQKTGATPSNGPPSPLTVSYTIGASANITPTA